MPGLGPGIHAFLRSKTWMAGTGPAMTEKNLHPKNLDVVRLDLLALLLDRSGVLLHHLDLGERLEAGLLLGERMPRAQAALVDDQLLALRRESVGLEEPRRVGIGRRLEHRVGADDEGHALGRVDRRDRPALLSD